MKDGTCSFFGHRNIEITDELKNKLFEIVKNLIEKGYEYFYFGGFGMFDELCYNIVSKLKLKYSHIKRVYCLSNPRHLISKKRPEWMKKEEYEEFVYLDLEFDWWYQRIYYRNCAIIDKSDLTIFYVEARKDSGAYKAFKYSQKKRKNYINLYNKTKNRTI